MQHLGQALILASFALSAATVVAAVAGAIRRRPELVRASSRLAQSAAWLNVAISLLLVRSILVHDFSNRYVASYTDLEMPLLYLLAAFWGGEKGALLFWALTLALLAGALARSRRDDGSPFFGWVNAVNAGALLFFDVLMIWASSPFETFLSFGGPPDGSGLNPLLMNPLMAIHPPFQLAGFVAYTLPFAFAVAALLTGQVDGAWIREGRRWYLLAWTLLTAGLIIGGLWAYLELGWGGFWGWDPVENAALLPWLAGTAMIHSASVESKRGMLRRWNFLLIFLTFLLTIFATFLTRSQLIQSLHSFSNSVLTPFFLYYMIGLVAVLAGLLAWRWRALAPTHRIEHVWSREALVVLNNAAFLLGLFIVLWGTLLPKLSQSPAILATINGAIGLWNGAIGGSVPELSKAIDVGPDWFNKVVAPVGLVILALTAIGPLVPLRSGHRPVVRRAVGRTGAIAAVAAVLGSAAFLLTRGARLADLTGGGLVESSVIAARGLGYQGVYGFLGVLFAAWALATVILDVRRSIANRREVTGERRGRALAGLWAANPKRFGGHLVHVGVALSFLGFAGAAGKITKKDVVMLPMERLPVGSTDLWFLGTHETWDADGQYAAVASEVLAWRHGTPLPDGVAEGVRAATGAASVESADAPELTLVFPDAEAARVVYAGAFARTVAAHDLKLVRVDEAARELHLAPRQLETLRVVPKGFHRMTEELQGLVAAVGQERLSLRTTRGDPLLVLAATDDAVFRSLVAALGAPDASPVRAARYDAKRPEAVRVIPAGVGLTLLPETRYYVKSENPTTEVDIDTGLLSDLYLASTPGQGSEAMNLTAMVNPLMSGVWVGALILVVAGFALALPAGRRRSPVAVAGEADREAVEGPA